MNHHLDELLRLGAATVYEASGLDCDLPHRLRPAWPEATLCGPALPVRCGVGDNLALHRVLERAKPGDVIVADGAGAAHGYWGEVLGVAARQRGVRGLVIDGGVRDVAQLRRLGFPVFSSAVALRGTAKLDPGEVDTTIHLDGRSVHPGDVVLADADGVLALPAGQVEAIVASARQRELKEAGYLDRIRAGELTLDIYSLR